MSIGERNSGGRRLVERLQQHVDRLTALHLTGDDGARVQDAIAELRKDIEDLEVIAPHVYVSPQRN